MVIVLHKTILYIYKIPITIIINRENLVRNQSSQKYQLFSRQYRREFLVLCEI